MQQGPGDRIKKPKITHYVNGESVKMHNKRITVTETEQGICVQLFTVDREDVNKPSAAHFVHKGIVRETRLLLSPEGMDSLCIAWIEHNKKMQRIKTSKQ